MGEIVRWRITSTWIDAGLLAMIYCNVSIIGSHHMSQRLGNGTYFSLVTCHSGFKWALK